METLTGLVKRVAFHHSDFRRVIAPYIIARSGCFALMSDVPTVLTGPPKRTATEPAVASWAGNRHSRSVNDKPSLKDASGQWREQVIGLEAL